jgi:DNA-directed RNA polymerase subunit K/omega
MSEKTAKPSKAGVFETVTVASARAKQLVGGCVPKVEGSAKLARRALQEVRSGAVTRNERNEKLDEQE